MLDFFGAPLMKIRLLKVIFIEVPCSYLPKMLLTTFLMPVLFEKIQSIINYHVILVPTKVKLVGFLKLGGSHCESKHHFPLSRNANLQKLILNYVINSLQTLLPEW